jgi:predicted nucleic acid-binding protein
VILVDSSIWIDHIRAANEVLADLLARQLALAHPFVIGEVALGHVRDRVLILQMLRSLPPATVARDSEVAALIEREQLFGLGIGYVDAHLLASARVTDNATLWTRDKRLHAIAERLSVAARVVH